MNQAVAWIMLAVGVGLLLWLAARTVRRARDLNERIEEYHHEQIEAEESAVRTDPYAAIADLYREQDRKEDGGKRA